MQGMTTSSLILSGTVVNALFLAFKLYYLNHGANADECHDNRSSERTMGSLRKLRAHNACQRGGCGVAFCFSRPNIIVFNAMMMGDEAALTLGIPLRFYWYLWLL